MKKKIENIHQFGFTFIEVLAVVVVVGILSLVSFLVFQGKRDSARATAAYFEMKKMAEAEMEVEANYDYLVPLPVLNDVPGPLADYVSGNADCVGVNGYSTNYWLIDPDTGYSANDGVNYSRKAKTVSGQIPPNIGFLPTNDKARKWKGPFVTYQRQSTLNGDPRPIDPWGNEYYLCTWRYLIDYKGVNIGGTPSFSNATIDRFAIISPGKDGDINSDADNIVYTFR
ncbi:MAG: type II secretion system protein [bacterium]